MTDYKVFFVVRLFQGATAGLFASIIPMVAKEVTPHPMVSLTGALPNLLIIFGLFSLYTYGFILGQIFG